MGPLGFWIALAIALFYLIARPHVGRAWHVVADDVVPDTSPSGVVRRIGFSDPYATPSPQPTSTRAPTPRPAPPSTRFTIKQGCDGRCRPATTHLLMSSPPIARLEARCYGGRGKVRKASLWRKGRTKHHARLKGIVMKIAAVLMVFAIMPITAPADQRLATVANGPSVPVRIDACAAQLADTSVGNVNYWIDEEVKFTNAGGQPITALRFQFDLLYAFGSRLRTMYGDVQGEFSPGVLIEPHYDMVAERFTSNVWSAINIDPNVSEVACSVSRVRFQDGTVWP